MKRLNTFIRVSAPIIPSIYRTIYEGRRPGTWRKASKYFKKHIQKVCQVCGTKKKLEAHDKIPYHCIKNPKKKSFTFWIRNFITLCRSCHFIFGHCSDPEWISYHSKITILVRMLRDNIIKYKTRCI